MLRIKRVFSILLCIMLCVSSVDIEVFANSGTGLVMGESGSIGGGGFVNPQGGTRRATDGKYKPTFRVTIDLHEYMYSDGTKESRANTVKELKNGWPILETNTNSLYFTAYNVNMGGNNPEGIGWYNAGSKQIMWQTDKNTRNSIIKLKQSYGGGGALNVVKTKLIAEGYGGKTKELSQIDITKLQSKITVDEAVTLWSYILGDTSKGYEIKERIEEVVSKHVQGVSDISTLSEAQLRDTTLGYIGLLTSYQKIARSKGKSQVDGNVTKLLTEYLEGNLKGITGGFVIDTAVPMVFEGVVSGKQLHLHIPSMDYVQYTVLTPMQAKIQTQGGRVLAKTYSEVVGNTKKQVLKGADLGLKAIPLSKTIKGTGVRRVGDYTPKAPSGSYQAKLLKDPFVWAGTVPGWYKEQVLVGNGKGESYPINTDVDAGYLGMLDFYTQQGMKIQGFVLVNFGVAQRPTGVTYKVDPTLHKMTQDACAPEASPVVPSKIAFIVKAEQSKIAELEKKIRSGQKVSIDIKGKVTRETYVNDKLKQGKTEIPILSSAITRVIEGEQMLQFLKGTPQTLLDTSVLQETFTRAPNGLLQVKYVYYIDDLTIKSGTREDNYTWDKIVRKEQGRPMNYAEHTASAYVMAGQPVPDTVIPKPKSTTDLDLLNPSVNETNSVMINHYTFSSGGSNYAEIKNHTVGQEKYEVMAGVPTTEDLYFAAGGQEYKLALVLQYWMNEKGVDRTYRTHYAGVECEYNKEGVGGDIWQGGPTVAQPRKAAVSPSISSGGKVQYDHKGGTVTVTWSGSERKKCSYKSGCPFTHDNCPVTQREDYEDAVKAAEELKSALESGVQITHTAGGDKVVRNFNFSNTGASVSIASSKGSDGAAGSHGDRTECSGGKNPT